MAAASALAGRLPPLTPRPLAGALTLSVLLAAGSLVPHPMGMVGVSAAFGLLLPLPLLCAAMAVPLLLTALLGVWS